MARGYRRGVVPERRTIVGLAALGGLVRRRELVGGEVEFDPPVPLRKGSARVAKWGGNLEMGISRAKPLAEICL